jgi:hypothetical protein
LRGGNRQLGHGKSDDAASRSVFQRARIAQPTIVEFSRQFVRQAGNFNRKAGAVRDGNVGQRENIAPAMPGRQSGKGIGADQQNQRLIATQLGPQALQRMHGVARRGRLDFAGID